MMTIVIQILRWLMQKKVWRFVGFASAIVGLVCYALSSSFNHLLGEWNLLKIILYTVFSFIICLMILHAKVWQSSRSLRFQAHTAFFVLTITSVYSFFSDKVVNGKPDAYSLISIVAFSIMSLSLSRQAECGFEIDLLYFFLGCLIVQLMKIKPQLVVVGVGFSYFLIILRSIFSSSAIENGYAGLPSEDSVIVEVDSLLTRTLQQENPNLMDKILELVKKYREDKHRLLGQEKLFQIDHAFVMDPLPSGKINDIREIAKLMVGAGAENEFADKYISSRRGFLQECLINKMFDLQKINIIDNNVENPETMIKNWITAFDAAIGILFPIEQRLCDRVFSGFSSGAARCFTEICQEATYQMLNFSLAIAVGSPSVSCLLNMIEMYHTLSYIEPQFRSLFLDTLATKVTATQKRLGEASRDLFMELDNLIFCLPLERQAASTHGHHHPITDHVINCITSVCDSQQMLEEILQKYPKVDGVRASCSFTEQIKRIVVMLETKLISKSENYKYPAMRHIFMINNRKRMEQSLSTDFQFKSFRQTSILSDIFGEDWFQENNAKIQQTIELYQRNSWNKVLGFLKLDSNESGVTPELLIDKLNLFNIHFEEISREQSTWFVYDKELREKIIKSAQYTLLPAYGSFIGKFHDFLGNHAYNYIEYGLFDIEDRLNHLFLVSSKREPGVTTVKLLY